MSRFVTCDDLAAPTMVVVMDLTWWHLNAPKVLHWMKKLSIKYTHYAPGSLFFAQTSDVTIFLLTWDNK